jgi:hypothetical protein
LKNAYANHVNPFAGATAHDVEVAKVAIEGIIKVIEADEIGPTKVLADGITDWRNRFMREMSGFRLVDVGSADILFEHFTRVHAKRFGPPAGYTKVLTVQEVLDNWHEETPMTQADIDRQWVIDSASAYEARQLFYGRDGNPDNLLRQLVDEAPVLPPSPDDATS